MSSDRSLVGWGLVPYEKGEIRACTFNFVNDIIYSIMQTKKLGKIRSLLTAMRRSPQGSRGLEKLAGQLGREPVQRGKEPMWESAEFDLYPLSIPRHGGRDLPIGTKNSILNQLEDDILAWEEKLSEEDDG